MTALAAASGYLIGSLPTAGFLARRHGVDLRAEGSGNPGTANALRTSGMWLAAAVLLAEAAKGYGAVLVGGSISDDTGAVAAGLGAVAGNVYNVWYRFQGGKGLGISLGVLIALWPLVLIPIVVVIVVGMRISRSSGIAALAAIATMIAASFLWPALSWPTAGLDSRLLPIISIGIAAIISWRHWRDARFSSPARR